MQLGGPELLIILAVVGLVFGPTWLPGLARSLGEAAHELVLQRTPWRCLSARDGSTRDIS